MAEVAAATTMATVQVETPPTSTEKQEQATQDAHATSGQEDASAAPPPRSQRSMRASTLINSRATIADQKQRQLLEQSTRKLSNTAKQEKRVAKAAAVDDASIASAAAVAGGSSPDDLDSSDSAWSEPQSKPRRPSKVKPQAIEDEQDGSTLPPFLPPPAEPVAAELAAGSLPPPPPLPPLPPAMVTQLIEAYTTTARKQGLLPPAEPPQLDDTTAAATEEDEGSDEDYLVPTRKSKKKRKPKAPRKRAIHSSTPASKRARPKKPAATVEVAAVAAAAPTWPPIPLELLQPPPFQPLPFTSSHLRHASTLLSLLAPSQQLDNPDPSSSSFPWQSSLSPLPTHDFTPMPFPPLPSAADAAAYLASSPPPEEPGMEEETTLRSTSALSCTPLSTAATPLSVPDRELADGQPMSPRAVADAMLLSSPGLIPFSFSSSPSPLRLAAQPIEASTIASPYPTASMLSAPFIPPIDPAKIRFGHLDSEAYRQRVKYNAAIARKAAAFEIDEEIDREQQY